MPAIQHDRSIQKVCQAIVRKGDAPDTNTFVVSTGDRDRDNDTLDPHGWDLSAYKTNPVILYGHAHADLPIAKCTDIQVVNGQLQATVQWPPSGLYEFADTVKGMARAGFIQSTSVGFRGLEWTPNPYGGRDYSRQQLIEVSLVPIPSNPNVRMVKGVDTLQLKHWLGSGRTHHMEDDMKFLEIDDGCAGFYTKDPVGEAFDDMCRQMLANYSEMDSAKFRELMAAQLACLGPLATIDQLVRALQAAGVYGPKRWGGDDDLFDVDPKELAIAVSHVIADEVGKQTRAALNAAVGRLD